MTVLKGKSIFRLSHFLQIFLITFTPTFVFSLLFLKLVFLQPIMILGLVVFSFGALKTHRLSKTNKPRLSGLRLVGNGPNGTQVQYSEALEASGKYPRDYLSKEFFANIQYSSRRSQPVSRNNEIGLHRDWNRDIQVSSYNVINGLRVTTDQPNDYVRTCSIFGTSQTFGEEVPDDLTCASFLQRILNSSNLKIKVVNHSRSASTIIERVQWFINNTPMSPGDLFVFIFGSNDCGWNVVKKGLYGSHSYGKSPLLRFFDRFLTGVEFLKSVHLFLIKRHNDHHSKIALIESVRAINSASNFADRQNVKILFLLQPVLYLSKTNTAYEYFKREQFSFYLKQQIEISYPKYEKFVTSLDRGSSLTTTFDDLMDPVYLDWVHVNARGHEILAKAIKSELDLWELL